jgi:cobalt-zinc-cadmium efflux system membrane fusion protein
LCLLSIAAGGYFFATQPTRKPAHRGLDLSSQARRGPVLFHPTDAQWAALTIEPVEQHAFGSEHATEGKIVVNEDRSTLVFSPYTGRLTKLFAKAGEAVARGQPLFMIEATEVIQVQNDFLAATAALNKARSQLNLAQIIERRQRELYEAKAVPLKDWQQSQAELAAAQNDARTGEAALEAVRNRLRILGRTDPEIAALRETARITPEMPVFAPIAGTVVQRKAGPGQFVNASSSEPVFVIGDLSTVWLLAYVRETEAPKVRAGQLVQFTVLAYPDLVLQAKLDFVASALEPATRRLSVRARVDNPSSLLKPEMFANVTIFKDEGQLALAIPREAVIYHGDVTKVWVAHEDKSLELRRVVTGVVRADRIQVQDGLAPGERVVTKGSLFIDGAAAGS